MEQEEVLSVWNSLDKIKKNMVATTFRRSFILKVPGSLVSYVFAYVLCC